MSLVFCALLGLSTISPRSANAGGGNGMGVMGTILGGGLVIVGVYGLTKDLPVATSCTANCAPAWGKVGVDLLEIAGGAVALSAAMQNESETRAPGGMPNFSSSSSTPGGGPGGGGNFDLCAQMPQACRVNPDTNRPQLALPPKSAMQAALTKSFNGQAVNPDGLSLDEALSDLDNKYDQAADAVAAFNSASDTGAFDSAMSGDSALAGTGQDNGDSGEGEGLNKGRGLANSGGGGGFEGLTLPNGETTDWASLLNKTKAERGPLAGAKSTGLNLEDARSGRVLNIWERVTRAIRGTRDRDILLAKVEWTRKLALKKQGDKKPNFAVSTEKN